MTITHHPITESDRLSDLHNLRWLEKLIERRGEYPDCLAAVRGRIAEISADCRLEIER